MCVFREWNAQELHNLQKAHLDGDEYVRHRLVHESRRRAQFCFDTRLGRIYLDHSVATNTTLLIFKI